jgi:hypothetical protein
LANVLNLPYLSLLSNGDPNDPLYEKAAWAGLQSKDKNIRKTAAWITVENEWTRKPSWRKNVEGILGKKPWKKP